MQYNPHSDIRQLRTFIAAAELDSFSKPADLPCSKASAEMTSISRDEVADMVDAGIWSGSIMPL